MRKVLFFVLAVVLAQLANADNYQSYQNNSNQDEMTIYVDSESNLVFRGTQRFRCSSKGWEIYLYQNSDFKMFDEDGKFVAAGTYSWNGKDEVLVYESDGSLAYKCYVSVNPKTNKPNYLVLAGDRYYNKD